MNIFITGTGTDVGKTVIASGIAGVMQGLGYKMGVYKPVQSGAVFKNSCYTSPDMDFVKLIDSNILTKTSYNMLYPAAPSVSAHLEGLEINIQTFSSDYQKISDECDFVLVEGAGGLLVPVFNEFLIRDLVKLLDLPLLIVAKPDLGTINYTLLTIEAARKAEINILGIVISNYPKSTEDISIKTAPDIISELSGVPILGILPKISEISQNNSSVSEVLIDAIINNIDLQKIFNIKIPKLSK